MSETTSTLDPALINQLLQQTLNPQPVPSPTQPSASSREGRGFVSLLGEALGGGQQYGTTAEREEAGRRALLSAGMNMLAASDYSYQPHTLGSIVGQGLGGAQRSLGESQAVTAAQQNAALEYQQKQQEMQLARIKEAIPLLQLQQQLRQADEARRLAGVTPPPSAGAGTIATGGSIAAAGRDEFVQKFTPLAQAISAQTGLPVEYVIGQAGLETGWGTSSATARNNFFGITDPKTGKLMSYASPQEGINAYTELMKSDRYKGVPRTGTPAEIGDRMALAGYNPNVPAKDKTDSYGARVGAFASGLGQQKPPGGAPAAVAATPAVQQGGETPPPPGAPAGAYAGGGFGEVLGPVAPNRGGPQYTVAPPPVIKAQPIPASKTGQRAGQKTADIIMEGVQQAQASPGLPGGVLAAGPAAPTGAGTPEPGWGTGQGAGSYGAGTFGGAAATPAQAQPPQPPAPTTTTQPPAPSPYPDIKAGEGLIRHPGTFAEYHGREYVPPPASEDFNPHLTPQQQAAFAIKQQALELKQRQVLALTDPSKGLIEVKAEQAALQAEMQTAAQAKAEAAAKALTKYNEAERDKIQTRYEAATKAYNDAAAEQAKLANDLTRERTKGEEARATGAAASENSYVLDERKRFGTDRDAARTSIDNLQMLRVLSNNAGTTTPLEALRFGDTNGRDLMVRLGFGTQAAQEHWGAQQAFEAAKNSIVLGLRAGVPMGALSDRDLSFIQQMGPDLLQKPETRAAIIALLERAQYAKRDYLDKVEELWDGGHGMTWAKAKREADKQMPPVMPQVPANFDDLTANEKRAFLEKYHIQNGSIVRLPDGTPGQYNMRAR